MRKQDKRLGSDDGAFKGVWQIAKESVRQLKHDHKRNTTWKMFRAIQINNATSSQSQAAGDNVP